MASKYVKDTVWQYLNANWGQTRIVDVENLYNTVEVSGDPPIEWTTLMDDQAIERQASLGAPGFQRWREEGTVSLIAFVPSGSGTARAYELAEGLRDLFRAQRVTDGAGGATIIFRDVSPPDPALPSSVDASSGAWFGYAVDATYYCDFCRVT